MIRSIRVDLRGVLIVIAAALLLTAFVTRVKVQRVDAMRGDSAFFFELARNAGEGAGLRSSLLPAILQVRRSGMLRMSAERVAHMPLPPPDVHPTDVLRLHTYFVMFPLALVAKALPPDVVLEGAFAASFVLVPALAMLVLRQRRITWVASAAFAAVVVAHGAWAEALLDGQFYPDRLFVLFGFILMLVVSRSDASRAWLVCVGLLCASVTERGAFIAGLVVVAYTALYWSHTRDRTFKLGLGAALFVAGALAMAFVTVESPYGAIVPFGARGVFAMVSSPLLGPRLEIFLEMNAPLLLLAAFAPRAAAIAALTMVPNALVLSTGGPRAWVTHYHSYYLPIAIWAALEGYVRLNALARSRRITRPVPLVTCALLAVAANCVDPTDMVPNIGRGALSKSFLPRLYAFATTDAPDFRAAADRVRRAVPPGSSVSSPEITMPELYAGRTVYFFPFGVERADYAVLGMSNGPDGRPAYSGVFSVLPAPQVAAVNAAIVVRMRRAGYDFKHAVAVPELGIVIVHRT